MIHQRPPITRQKQITNTTRLQRKQNVYRQAPSNPCREVLGNRRPQPSLITHQSGTSRQVEIRCAMNPTGHCTKTPESPNQTNGTTKYPRKTKIRPRATCNTKPTLIGKQHHSTTTNSQITCSLTDNPPLSMDMIQSRYKRSNFANSTTPTYLHPPNSQASFTPR